MEKREFKVVRGMDADEWKDVITEIVTDVYVTTKEPMTVRRSRSSWTSRSGR